MFSDAHCRRMFSCGIIKLNGHIIKDFNREVDVNVGDEIQVGKSQPWIVSQEILDKAQEIMLG
jgi:hypothetical protein